MSPARRPRHGHTAPTPVAESWHDLAACGETSTELFYPPSGAGSGPAKAVCARCPVRAACLDHALVVGERHGVWDGLTEDERRALRRQRAEGAA